MKTVKGHMGSVSFDGRTVVVYKTVRGSVRIPVETIQSVSILRAGIGMRGIRFAVAGGSVAPDSRALGSHRDLARDPYALTFRKRDLPQFEQFAELVEQARSTLA